MKKLEYTSKGIWVDGDHIELSTIIEEVKMKQIEEENLVLFAIEWGYTRNWDGCVEKMAIPLNQAIRMKELIVGRDVDLGEINGKHSQIYGTVKENEVTINKDSKDVLNFISNYPNRYYAEHSFWEAFAECADGGGYDGMEKETIKEICSY